MIRLWMKLFVPFQFAALLGALAIGPKDGSIFLVVIVSVFWWMAYEDHIYDPMEGPA